MNSEVAKYSKFSLSLYLSALVKQSVKPMQETSINTLAGFMPIWVYLISISMLMDECSHVLAEQKYLFQITVVPLQMKSEKNILLKPVPLLPQRM